MNRSSRPRTTAVLSKSLNQELSSYALAAEAAGLGLLALAQPAEAKIIYTPAHVQVNGIVPIDLNHDGINDFFLFNYGFHTSSGGGALLVCLNPFNNGSRTVCASSSFGTNALNAFRVVESMGNEWGAAVKPGAKIIGGDRFRSGHSADLGQVTFPTSSHQKPVWGGPWMNGGKGVKNRYVGIKFQIKGRFHFGWARVTVTTQGNSFTARLTGYAYETIPNKGIVAGKTKGPEKIDSQPASATLSQPIRARATLGTLALGAPGLSIWRREESLSAKSQAK